MSLPVVRSYLSGSDDGGSAFNVALGAGAQSGDTVYCVHGSNDFPAASINAPTGNGTWSLVATTGGTGLPAARSFIGDLTVSGAQNLAIPATTGSGHTALVVVFEGGTTVDASFGELIVTASPHVFDGVTAVADASLLLVSWVSLSTGNYVLPGSLTSRININSGTLQTPSVLGSAELAAAGATGSYSSTLSPSFDQAGAIGVTFPDTEPPVIPPDDPRGVLRRVPRARRVRR